MLNRPQFKPHLRVEPVPNEGVFLLSELGHHVLTGPLSDAVAPLIDGERTADAIADELLPDVSMKDVYYTLAVLRRDGHLIEAPAEVAPERAAFWSAVGLDPIDAEARLRASTVAIRVTGDADSAALRELLAQDGIAIAGDGVAADLTVVVTDDYDRPELAGINAEHLAAGRPWMLIKAAGVVAWVGPLFLPRRTGCWECLAQRMRGNREVEAFIARSGRAGPFPVSSARTQGTLAHALGLATTQVAIYLGSGGANSAIAGSVYTVNVAALRADVHVLVRRPQCPACGDPRIIPREPIRLNATPAELRENGVRGVSPETTYERYKHHISPITGVVTSLTPAAGLGPMHVYIAGHNFAFKNDTLYFLQAGLRSKSAGKGRTDAQARTSALCEAIERYSGNYRPDEVESVRATMRELGELALDPRASMLFSERQYDEREQWMARRSRFQIVPQRFRDDARLDWTPVWSLTNDVARYLPTGYLYYGMPVAHEEATYWPDSNGNAAGNTLEEAILQGFLELVERDSVGVWWYNRLSQPGIDLTGFDEPYLDELRAYYAQLGREIWALDLTTDTGIPAVVALTRRIDAPLEEIVVGFGAHFDAKTALMRAITEMNQFMPAVINRNPDGTTAYAYDDPDAISWWQTATVANQPYLAPSPYEPLRRRTGYASMGSNDVADDVRTCIRIARSLGLEMFVLDQTRPDVGLPVVKVIVPGLRHFWARYAPGRLYDVPVRMGKLAMATPEALLNPTPLFL